MPDYSQTIIYKLCCNDLAITDIYVGSTCNFNRRKSAHKSRCNNVMSNGHNYKVYKYMRENGGFDNWSMVIIFEANLDNKLEKDKLEKEWTDAMGATLNTVVIGRTMCEYRLDKKESISEQRKKHYEANKESISEYQQQHYQKNKQRIKEQSRNYYQANKESISKSKKKYYNDNKTLLKKV